MRAPAVFAIIALSALNAGTDWAKGSVAQETKSGLIVSHHDSQKLAPAITVNHGPQKLEPVGSRAPNTASRRGASNSPSRSTPDMGHFVPRVSKASTAAALSGTVVSGSELGHHVPRPSALGGPTQYDAKKGAIVGGEAMGKRK